MTEREAMQKAFEIIGVLKPDNFVHRELQGEAWDLLRQALAQPEPQVCCGDYEKCIKSCTPRGRWLTEKEFTKEKPLPLVDIGVDVTPEGTHVVAFYNKHNAVQEMFYSKFHPLAKFEQSKYSDIISDGGFDPRNKFDAHPEQEPEIVRRVRQYAGRRRESVNSPHITAKECIALANWIDSELAAPSRKEWVGLTEGELIDIKDCNRGFWVNAAKIEQLLKDKNT